MKSILILGSSGLLGKELVLYLKKYFKIYHNGLNKRKLDLTKYNDLKKIFSKNFDVIINCIALTNLENCEKNKIYCNKINFQITKRIFEIKNQYNLNFKYIFISTDQLYNSPKNSKETDKLSIFNSYSNFKRKAEKIALRNNGIVLRTNFFGKTRSKKSFTDWIYKKFKSKNKFYLFQDIYFSPVRIVTLCRVIKKIINKSPKNSEIFNIGTKKGLSKKDFAIFFAKKCGIYKKNYKINSFKKILKTKRSKYMTMNSFKFEKKYKFKFNTLNQEILHEVKNYKN